MGLEAADARAVEVMCKEHGRSSVERPRLDVWIEESVREQNVWFPVAERVDGSIDPDRFDVPNRRLDACLQFGMVERSVAFMQQGEFVPQSLQVPKQVGEVRACASKPAITPVGDGYAHVSLRVSGCLKRGYRVREVESLGVERPSLRRKSTPFSRLLQQADHCVGESRCVCDVDKSNSATLSPQRFCEMP